MNNASNLLFSKKISNLLIAAAQDTNKNSLNLVKRALDKGYEEMEYKDYEEKKNDK